MAYVGPVARWDIYLADLDHPVGSEQGGTRPVLILSNDRANNAFSTVTVVPLTSIEGKARKAYPGDVVVPGAVFPNGRDGWAQAYQVRTIAKQRLLELICTLEDTGLRHEIENAVLVHLDIDFEEDETT